MAAKALLILCAQTLFIQTAYSQCVSPAAIDIGYAGPFNRGLGYDGVAFDGLAYDALAYGAPFGIPGRPYDGFIGDAWPSRGFPCGTIEITPTAGGLMPVTSSSAIPPVGISVVSENAYEGLLAVAGEVPFVGTTAMEGALPSGGAGAINYGCGNGVTAMVSETGPGVFGPAAVNMGSIASLGVAPAIGYGNCGHGYVL